MPRQVGPRTRLEQLVQAAQLSPPQFCQGFAQAATQTGVHRTVSVPQAKRWLSGQNKPQPDARRVLATWWGEPIAELLGPPRSETPVIRRGAEFAADFVDATARVIADHAIAAAHALHDSALEQLRGDARRVARAYFTDPPADLLVDVERLRAQVHDQLGRTGKPRQQAELLLILAQVSGLLASISTALGRLDAAESLALAAHTYAEIIDQPSLCAWARALQVAAVFWADRPDRRRAREAVDIAAAALVTAPAGTARARLLAVQARAWARLGARDEVHAAMGAAADELDRAGDDPILDRVGGDLGFSPARVALCGASAYVLLRDAVPAARAAEAALSRFSLAPPDERWMAGEIGARIDLGTARALGGDLAGAEDALMLVFGLPAARRTDALTQRMRNLGRLVTTQPYRRAPEAVRIDEQIEAFLANTLGTTVRQLTAAQQ